MSVKFIEGFINDKFLCGNSYISAKRNIGRLTSLFPSLSFYSRLFWGPFYWLCRRAAKGLCEDSAWIYGSIMTAELLELTGCRIIVEGMDYISSVNGPCVFVANHMSTLETFMLPGIIRPRRHFTFVVKESLIKVPFFGAVMRSRDPIVVGRKNPRQDLTTVLEGGQQRLEQGTSILVFPQSTRSKTFDPEQFNSIGIKLAKRAHVPVIPIALKTDAWGQGAFIKDFGAITPAMPIRYRFAPAMNIDGTGKAEHKEICNFISSSLTEWEQEDVKGNKKGLPV